MTEGNKQQIHPDLASLFTKSENRIDSRREKSADVVKSQLLLNVSHANKTLVLLYKKIIEESFSTTRLGRRSR